jgi:serine phosphatase RsbU (regulator of sigma subunit)
LTLGTLYGRACFAKEPIARHLQDSALCIATNQSLTDVLQLVSSRKRDHFYEDVLLIDQDGRFKGLISTQKLIQLQQRMLEENIEKLEATNLQLDRRNRQMESELLLARELQLSILPRQFPQTTFTLPTGQEATLDFQHRYLPSGSVGGDFFQVLLLSDDRVGIFLCDVMGHGVQAALVTAMIRATLEVLQPFSGDAGELLRLLNKELVRMLSGSDSGLFATALYLVMDCRESRLTFASAGHPPGVHIRPGQSAVSPLIDACREA